MIMVDWVTAKLPFYFKGVLSDGEIININRLGEVEYSVTKRLMIEGSYDARISIRTSEVDNYGNTSLIEFSGNPVKFLQGHNLFGSSDLLNLVIETVLKISGILGVIQPKNVLEQLKAGHYTLSRVDLNRMINLGNRASVIAYTYSMSSLSRTRAQAATTRGSTVYLNKDSKRWSFKFYSKGQEISIARNRKQGTITLPQPLRDWADSMLRAELTLKSKELREIGLYKAYTWGNIEEIQIFSDYMNRIEMSPQIMKDDLFATIRPRAAAATYQLWKDGHDVRELIPIRTYYRHRKCLLEFQVDISIPPPLKDVKQSNVIPIAQMFKPESVAIPHWAYGTDLYFEPRKLSSC